MKSLKTNVSVSLDIDIIEKVKELSENVERSFSQYVNMVLREHIVKIEAGKKKD